MKACVKSSVEEIGSRRPRRCDSKKLRDLRASVVNNGFRLTESVSSITLL